MNNSRHARVKFSVLQEKSSHRNRIMAWKIATLALLTVVVVLSIILVVRRSPVRPTDRRLIGTWVSDRERTIAESKEVWGATEDRLEGWSELLGKMSITFSERMVETDLNGEKLTTPYSVLAYDRTSVVLRDDSEEGAWAADVLGLSTFSKIHFDGNDSYWVFSEPGAFKEYFRRVSDSD